MFSLGLAEVRNIYGCKPVCPKKLKQDIIRKVGGGSSIRHMSDETGVSYTTIWNWIHRPDGTNKK